MKHKVLRITSVFVSFLAVFSLIPAGVASAAPSSIYFSPASGTYTTGNAFAIQVRGNSDPIYFDSGSTSGTINFPASRLRVNSISTSGSSYSSITVNFNNSTGTISWNGSSYPSPTNIYFFTINFQALTAGTAAVTFSAETSVNYNPAYNIWTTNKTNASYTLVNPPPATCPAGQIGTPPNCTTPPPASCPAGQVGTPPNCTTPAPSGGGTTPEPTTPTVRDTPVPTPTAQPDAAPVQVDAGDLSIKDVVATTTRTANALAWKTTLPNVTTELSLGTAKDKLTVKPTVVKQADGSFLSTMENLKPGVRYYFTITATATSDAQKKATFSGAFTTRGYPVKLVVAQDGKKVAGATIEIEKQSFKTDKDGALDLELTDSTFNAVITAPDKTKKNVTFTVAKKTIPTNGGNPETQTFTFDLSVQQANETAQNNPLVIPIISAVGGLVALLVGGALFLLYRRRKADESSSQTATVEAYPAAWEGQATDDVQPTTYIPPEERQLSNLAAIEQQFIPETEPQQPEAVYEAQSDAPVQTFVPVTPPEQTDMQPGTVSEMAETVEPTISRPVEALPDLPSDTETIAQVDTPAAAKPVEAAPAAEDASTADTTNETTEEAVYHPDTGELDIIHPHEHANTPLANINIPAAPAVAPADIDASALPLPPNSADVSADSAAPTSSSDGATT